MVDVVPRATSALTQLHAAPGILVDIPVVSTTIFVTNVDLELLTPAVEPPPIREIHCHAEWSVSAKRAAGIRVASP